MPSDRQAVKVFYCYSHKDQALRDDLGEHLRTLCRQGIIEDWHDRCIGPGQEWRCQLDEHLETAQIILLLISSSFIASDYCYDIEMARALERHKAGQSRVIPVHLRPVDWAGTPFAELQGLPTDAVAVTEWQSQDKAFQDIARGIRRAALEWQQPSIIPSSSPPPRPIDPQDLRANYLALMAEEWRTLYQVSLDPKAADAYSPRPLTLEQVYITLDTTTPRPDALRRNEQDEFGWLRPEKPLSALEAMCYARDGHMVLVGEPGSGKTTFARYLALAMAKVLRGSSHLKEEIPGWEGEALLPLFVSLGLFASSLQPTETTGSANLVMDFVRQQINNHPELTGYGESLISELNNEGGLVIFDGLDEVPDYQRQLTKVAITNFAAINGRCKVLVTCRRHSYQQKPDWVLNWPEVHELAPLSSSKILTFIDAWYKALSVRDSTTDYKLKADTLKAALVSEDYSAPTQVVEFSLKICYISNKCSKEKKLSCQI